MRKAALLVGAAFVWPFAANADISYNYLQGDWIADGEIESGSAEDDYDGWSLEGSAALTPNVFLSGEYNDMSLDDGDDFETMTLGVGLKGSLQPTQGNADVYGMISYEDLENGIKADGYGLTAGARWVPTIGIEVNPSIAYVDYGEIDGTSVDLDGWRYGVRGLFNLTDQLALNAEWRTNKLELEGGGSSADLDLENEIRIGARWYWM